MASGSMSLTELAVLTGLLTALAAVAFGRHVVDGGFYSDDWANAALYGFGESPRFSTPSVNTPIISAAGRCWPFSSPFRIRSSATISGLPIPSRSSSASSAASVVTSSCERYRWPASRGRIASLALVFPWADSIRLWPRQASTPSPSSSRFSARSSRSSESPAKAGSTVALAGSAALYALSVFTYEVAAVALLLVGSLYLFNAPRAKALGWWAIHAAVVGARRYTALTTAKAVGRSGPARRPATVRAPGSLLLSYSFVPPGTTSAAPDRRHRRRAAVVLVGVWR